MQKVADLAEEMQHHPKWSNEYSVVTISLSTHDAGNSVTEKDEQMAKAISEIAAAIIRS